RHGDIWIATERGVTRYRPLRTSFQVRIKQVIADQVYGADKPQFSLIIRKMLVRQYDVVCVDDIYSGRLQLNCADFDGVIVAEKAVGGGLQLVEYMKMNPALCHLPIILTCIQPTEAWAQYIQLNDVACLIAKPFRPSTLLAQLEVLFAQGEPLKQAPEDVYGIVAAIGDNLARLKRVLPEAPHFKAETTDESIFHFLAKNDQAQASILALANSSYSPAWRQIDSAKLAVNMMGLDEAETLIQCVDVIQRLQTYAPKSRFNLSSLFKHAIGTAHIARAIGKQYAVDEKKCFKGGLIHDFGKVVLDCAFSSVYSSVREAVHEGRLSYVCAEEDVLGFTHCLAGGYLAHYWDLGEDVVEAIVCHHNMSLARHHVKLASILYLADAVCSSLGFGSTGEIEKPSPTDPMFKTACWKLGVTPQIFDGLLTLGKKELKYAQAVVDAIFKQQQV
ncbi:MAG: HDOD domain-containing protein, partial [Candidatus Latescibacterota bacterium]